MPPSYKNLHMERSSQYESELNASLNSGTSRTGGARGSSSNKLITKAKLPQQEENVVPVKSLPGLEVVGVGALCLLVLCA